MEGTGEGCGFVLFSEVTLFKYNVSTILSSIVGIMVVGSLSPEKNRKNDDVC